MELIGILINCITVGLHMFSMILSTCIFVLVVYRWNYNRHHPQRTSIASTCVFNNSISLLLIGNTYFTFIIYSATWLSILIHTIAGDFSLFKNILYLGDSLICRVQVAIIFFLTSAFFHSFLLQALWCFFKVFFYSRLHTKKIYCLPLNRIYTYILLILITWIISLLIIIPAHIIFSAFSYFPDQYHCLISFSNVRGFTYSLLSTYVIPMILIIYIYIRLLIFIHYLPIHNRVSRARRDLNIVKRILIICITLAFTGSPTVIFLFQFLITGQIHPLADRIHELGVAINTNIVTIGFALLNSLAHLLPVMSTVRR